MASSGYLNTNAYDGRYLKLSWEVKSQSIANNASTISWTLAGAGKGGSSWYKAGNFKAVINGITVYQSSTRINLYEGTVVAKGELQIAHNSDGKKSFSASAEAAIYLTTVNCKGSGTFDLPQISRFASITDAPDFTDEENPVLQYSNPAGTVATTLQAAISLDGLTADIPYRDVSKSKDNYKFSLTTAEKNTLLKATASAKSKTVYFLLKTVISGNTNIDKESAKFSVVNASPTIGGATYKDTNSKTTGITGNNQIIIRNNSSLQITVTGLNAVKSASLKSISVNVNGAVTNASISSGQSVMNVGHINVSANITAVITLTDSRGFTAKKNLPITVQNWTAPTAIITAQRKNNFYTETDLTVKGKYSSLGGKNDLTIQYQYKRKIDSNYNSYTTVANNATTELSLDNKFQWNLRVKLKDLLGSTTYNLIVDKGIPIMFLDRELNSVGVCGFPTRENTLEIDGKTVDDFISDRVQAGNATITSVTANTLKEVDVVFPRAFTQKPRVVVTPNTKTPVGVDCGVTSITTTGFKLWYNSTANRSTTYVLWVAYLDEIGETQADTEEIAYPDGTPPRPITEKEYSALLAKPDANTTYSLSKSGSTITLAGSDGSRSSVEDTSGGGGAIDKTELINMIYPVGSIYMSVNATSPATLFGGTWQQIKDNRFILASDKSCGLGGEATHTLTVDEMPAHTHTWSGTTSSA